MARCFLTHIPVALCIIVHTLALTEQANEMHSSAITHSSEMSTEEQRKPQQLVFESDEHKRKRQEFAARINPLFQTPPKETKVQTKSPMKHRSNPTTKHRLEAEKAGQNGKHVAEQLNPFHNVAGRAAVSLHSAAKAQQAVVDAKKQLAKQEADMRAAKERLAAAEKTWGKTTAEWKAVRSEQQFGDALRLLSQLFGKAHGKASKQVSEFLLRVADNRTPLESEVATLIKNLTWVDPHQFKSALDRVMKIYNERTPLESHRMKHKLEQFAKTVNPHHDPFDKLDATDHEGALQKWHDTRAKELHNIREKKFMERKFLFLSKNFSRAEDSNLTGNTHPETTQRPHRFQPFSPNVNPALVYGFPVTERMGLTGNPLVWSITIIYGGLTVFVLVLFHLWSDLRMPRKMTDIPLMQ